MLNTLPLRQIVAIYNANAPKPVAKFENAEKGIRRTQALLDRLGISDATAAKKAGITLAEPVAPKPAPAAKPAPAPKPAPAKAEAAPIASTTVAASTITAAILVEKLNIDATLADAIAAFIRRTEKAKGPKAEKTMTDKQETIVELCGRPKGATGKELAEGVGWPTIAARTTCQNIADRYGYTLTETPKGYGRGVSFHLAAKKGG
jgi:hypothetical protein